MSWLSGLKNMIRRGELPKRDPEKSDFCYYPFFQVLMTAGGKYMPCSKHETFITDNGRVLVSDKDSIEDAWNSDYMRELRTSFQTGKQMTGCHECWREEKMGLRSMRYDSYGYNVSEAQVKKPQMPMRVEINASNICNLRCRICMPTASHRWIPEAKKLYNWNEETHFNMTPQNIEAIKSWVSNFTQIGFFGGEPLMSHENIELMRYCVKTGHSKHISILLNTNGTVYSDEIVQLFLQFQKVFINFSIDDIGDRFEYERSGATWNEVVQNMKSYLKYGGHADADIIEVKICCSVTNMNIWYFPEYFQFMNEHFPKIPVYWNLVYAPWEFSIEILPEEVKEKIRTRLRNYVKTTYRMSREKTKTIEDLILFLDNKTNKEFSGFFQKIKLHDEYRQESFVHTFPEWWDIIKHYQLARFTV